MEQYKVRDLMPNLVKMKKNQLEGTDLVRTGCNVRRSISRICYEEASSYGIV